MVDDENLFDRIVHALLDSDVTHDDAVDMARDAFTLRGVSL